MGRIGDSILCQRNTNFEANGVPPAQKDQHRSDDMGDFDMSQPSSFQLIETKETII